MSNETLKEQLRALVAEIAEKDEIPDGATFKDLGIDSMMGVEIVAAVERQYQIKIEDDELGGLQGPRRRVRARREEARGKEHRRRGVARAAGRAARSVAATSGHAARERAIRARDARSRAKECAPMSGRSSREVPPELDFPEGRARDPALLEGAPDLREDAREARAATATFVFYEGPPTANGLPHNGHVLTRVIKDLFPRYKTMRGWTRAAQGRLGHARPARRGRGREGAPASTARPRSRSTASSPSSRSASSRSSGTRRSGRR